MDTFSAVRGICVGVAEGVTIGGGFSMTIAGVDRLKGGSVPGATVGLRMTTSVSVGLTLVGA
jgi:hypothetical protein